MRYAPKKRSSPLPWILGSVVLVILIVGAVGALWAMEKIELPFLKRPPKFSREGLVGVPTSGQPIPMYTRVTRDHLYDPKYQSLAVTYVKPESLRPNVLLRTEDIIGRVLNHNKPAGYVFTEEDFAPKGTKEGLVAGIPPGKRALTLEAEKLKGVRGFQAGDHLDMIGTLAVDDKNAQARNGLGALTIVPGALANPPKHAVAKILVQNGIVVSPVTTRQVPVSSSSLTSGIQTRTKPVQEVVIAVDPTEVAPLTEALALSEEILCVARSGRPDDDPRSLTPGTSLPPKPTVVEIRAGSRQEVVAFGVGTAGAQTGRAVPVAAPPPTKGVVPASSEAEPPPLTDLPSTSKAAPRAGKGGTP